MCDSNGLQKQEPLNAMMQLYQARGEVELLKERILHADAEINRVAKESDGFKKQVEVLLKRINIMAKQSEESCEVCMNEGTFCKGYGDKCIDYMRAWSLSMAMGSNAEQKQATNCAVCGIRKHTPLRNDTMGGYVCMTCISEELVRLQRGKVVSGE